jgi:hypothetical protein
MSRTSQGVMGLVLGLAVVLTLSADEKKNPDRTLH